MTRPEVLSQLVGSAVEVEAATRLVGLISDTALEWIDMVSSGSPTTLIWANGSTDKVLRFTVKTSTTVQAEYQNFFTSDSRSGLIYLGVPTSQSVVDSWFTTYFGLDGKP